MGILSFLYSIQRGFKIEIPEVKKEMAIKYLSGLSTGLAFTVGETRTVVVTAESVSVTSGFEGDSVTYTATVKDDAGESLPATFVADLQLGAMKVIEGIALGADVYDPVTGALTLTWAVPDTVGTFTVSVVWAEQII